MIKTKLIETITLPPLKGGKVIEDAKDMFNWIDSDFKNYGANKPGEATTQMKVEVRELKENATFQQMFQTENVLTQDQIIYFIENFKNLLRNDGNATFFPFKSGSEFFVASVRFRGGEQLEVYVSRFSRDYVWDAECRRRFVVPQLTLDPSDKPLRSSDTSSLESSEPINVGIRFKEIKKGFKVNNETAALLTLAEVVNKLNIWKK